ncbi:MAG: hypothetical protein KF691_07870 [Phycisphaeraceae bacterium]|nr:hypothetical protein [Phycisphaeraceae bacterium]
MFRRLTSNPASLQSVRVIRKTLRVCLTTTVCTPVSVGVTLGDRLIAAR